MLLVPKAVAQLHVFFPLVVLCFVLVLSFLIIYCNSATLLPIFLNFFYHLDGQRGPRTTLNANESSVFQLHANDMHDLRTNALFGDIRMKSFPETTRVKDSIKKKKEDYMKSILFVIVIH